MVTIEEIKRLASLAKLRLTDDELHHMVKHMSSIIAFADTINAVVIDENDKAGLSPEQTARAAEPLRRDIVTPSLPVEAILRNAGGGENGYFRIRKRK